MPSSAWARARPRGWRRPTPPSSCRPVLGLGPGGRAGRMRPEECLDDQDEQLNGRREPEVAEPPPLEAGDRRLVEADVRAEDRLRAAQFPSRGSDPLDEGLARTPAIDGLARAREPWRLG